MWNLIEIFSDKEPRETKEKKSFWASEAETPLFDLYHRWMGTPPTNEIELNSRMIMDTGKELELSLVKTLEEKGLVKKMEEQTHVEFEYNGLKISGYTDAILNDGKPLEIKSFYGNYQERELSLGKARTSYLKQLAIYMHYLKEDTGILLYVNRGNGMMYQFTLERTGTEFKCGDIEFDLRDTFKRWKDLYDNYILKGIEPKSEFRYKIPIEEIDWSQVPKATISKARNNQKVIGDSWKVNYSPYKNLIIEREGTTLGYTDEELEKIRTLTQGYTNWDKPI